MELNLAEILFFIPFACFLFVLYVYIPWMILHPAVSTLIGRPLGFGWKRVDAEICAGEPEDAGKARVLPKASVLRFAEFETNGEKYKIPLFGEGAEGACRLYVKQKKPQEVWQPKYESKLTALAGAFLILALWAGLVFAGIYIAQAIRG
ncbi:MAG: hypothetical protein IKQ91_06360 [Oscillospiraceae bacterium]|nr:hypothetical protein [Oscillospiraceae bacterium]